MLPADRGGDNDGYAADDGAALVFAGETLSEVVSSRPDAAAYRVTRTAVGRSAEERIPARYLGGEVSLSDIRWPVLVVGRPTSASARRAAGGSHDIYHRAT